MPTLLPNPVLFNTLKHHAATLRQGIQTAVAQGEAGLETLAKELVVIGTELMDLYTGDLTPAQITDQVLAHLQANGLLEAEAYQTWIEAGGGYRVVTLAEDGSQWVLRLGELDGPYIHLHPARWAPATVRVRANVLKTAIMVLAYVGVHGGNSRHVPLINRVRQQYLDFCPIGKLLRGEGLDVIFGILEKK